ncbi:MAG TPA: hypothetical protein DCE56_12080 [Cyanobacteria bacterium UBA8553]|nr:hypothetical protein [Cyanobacteria bacterium UBA8553]HAJ63127.1 hypothetical protein [Cyanobacteria bacterium UBA8543]
MKLVGTQQKRLVKASSFAIAFVLFPLASLAIEVKDVPNPRQIDGTWVTDQAGILSNETETQLNQMIAQLERKNGTEIAVVTVPETAPAASPREFTTKLFNYWGIGKKGKDNGVLFLISKGDRRVEIETGYGIEAILPDAKVGNIINTQITPQYKKGDFNSGTLAGTKALVVALETPQASSVSKEPTPTAIASGKPYTTLDDQPSARSQNLQQPTEDGNVPWLLLVGGGLVLAGGTAACVKRSRVLIEPEGHSRLRGSSRLFLCANCNKPMNKVEDTIIQSTLSKPEKVAQKLGSVRFEGWKCPECSQQLTGLGFHTVAYESHSAHFRNCPTCQELTVTHARKTLKRPTHYSSGTRLISDKCHCCDYYIEWEETIPRLSTSSSSRSWSSGSGSGSFSSGAGSSGGGGFGGGSSGGGGAGGGW